MIVRDITKGQRHRLRQLAALALERELARELAALEQEFIHWHRGELGSFDLNDAVHRFHADASRKLYLRYQGDPDLTVADAIVRGILSESDIGDDIRTLLDSQLRFLRSQ